MEKDNLKIYDVSWGLGTVKHKRTRAENALEACSNIRERYGWTRAGTYTVDAATRGINCCEMPVNRANGKQTLLVAVLS